MITLSEAIAAADVLMAFYQQAEARSKEAGTGAPGEAIITSTIAKGYEVKINWPGRWSVWPLMSAVFFALCGMETFAEVLLYIGIALALWASALYAQSAARQLREPSTSA